MDKPRNAEERAFWDAAYVASFPLWGTHAAAKALRTEKVPTIAEFGALIAGEALTERRKITGPDASP